MNTIMGMGQYHVQIYSWFEMIFRNVIKHSGPLRSQCLQPRPHSAFT